MINLIVKFTTKPESRDAFTAALIADRNGAHQEAKCIEFKVYTDKKNPNIIFAYERWESQEALDSHAEQAYTKNVSEVAETSLKSAPEFFSLEEA